MKQGSRATHAHELELAIEEDGAPGGCAEHGMLHDGQDVCLAQPADYWQPPRPAQSWHARVLFKICFVLMILMPVLVLVIAARAIFVGSTSTDTGTPRWQPPSSPWVPIAVSFAAIPLLVLLVVIFRCARRRCSHLQHLETREFWGHADVT